MGPREIDTTSGRGATFEKYSVRALKSSYRTVESPGFFRPDVGMRSLFDYFEHIPGARFAFRIQAIQ